MNCGLPLADFNVLTTSDVDEALLNISRRHPCSDRLVPLGARRWKLVTNAYSAGDVSLIATASEGYEIDGQPDGKIWLAFPLNGDISLDVRGRQFRELGRSEGFFLGHESRVVTVQTSSSVLMLKIGVDPLSSMLSLLDCHICPIGLADSYAGQTGVPGVGSLRRALMHTIWEIEKFYGSLAENPIVKKQVEQTLLLRTASFIAGVQGSRQNNLVHARVLRRAMDYIRTTPPDEFSYEDLARQAGASLRSIQMAFRSELDTTIRDWVRDFRLDTARNMLRAGQPQSITSIAMELGFSHAGRFSTQYFNRFGEYPSATQRRK